MTEIDVQHVDTTMLPTQMSLLINIIGLPETVKLIDAYGGHRVRISATGQSKELEQHISKASVKKLSESTFSGQRVTLPKADKLVQQLRNMDIVANRGNNTKRELARKYNLTSRTIQKIWNSTEDANPTGDLFA